MSEIKDGGPAFPVPLNPGEGYKPENHGPADGMTLRDYFAAKTMAGMLAKEGWPVGMDSARSAYVMADCMLRARGES